MVEPCTTSFAMRTMPPCREWRIVQKNVCMAVGSSFPNKSLVMSGKIIIGERETEGSNLYFVRGYNDLYHSNRKLVSEIQRQLSYLCIRYHDFLLYR